MFHKANSSVLSNARKDTTKKAKDVPLRKSDRKAIRQIASSLLNCNDETLLDLCFLEGSMFSRQIQLPDAKATLYFRSPSPALETSSSSLPLSSEVRTEWPFHFHPECIWIELDSKTLVPGNNSNKPHILHVPSVALLSVLPPNSFPAVIIPSETSKFVCRGADLMRPGIRGYIPPTTKQQQSSQAIMAVCVIVHGNPQAFAVGLLASDLANDFKTNVQKTGVGVTIVSAYGDDLWKHQLPPSMVALSKLSLFDLGHYGNAGFLDGKIVKPFQTSVESIVTDIDEVVQIVDDDDDDDDDGNDNNEGEMPSVKEENETSILPSNDMVDKEICHSDSHDLQETNQDTNNSVSKHTTSPDDILHAAVCKALSILQPQKKKLLPMRIATFYAQYVLPNRPDGTSIELKKTKYKKFSVYVAEQVERGLVSVGSSQEGSRKDPMGMLVDFDVRHDDLREYIELRKANDSIANGSSDPKEKKLVLTDLYCVPNHFHNLLRLDADVVKATNASSNERRGTGMLTLKEMRAILDDYIERENLVDPLDRNMILIDGPLKDALYKQKKPSETSTSTIPTHIPRKDLVSAWTGKMESAYALVEVPGNKVLRIGRGQAPSVTIEVSRRQSNKFVTQLRGYEELGIDADVLCHEVSQRFACAAKIVTTQSSTKRTCTELLIQGNLAQELEALLTGDASKTKHGGAKDSPFCLPKNAVQKVLRKGVPSKK